MKRVLSFVLGLFLLILCHCAIWILDAVEHFQNWSKKKVDKTTLRLILVYLLGVTALGVGWFVGILGPIFFSAGWIGWVVGGLVLCHIGLAFYTLSTPGIKHSFIIMIEELDTDEARKVLELRAKYRKSEALVTWLDKIDTSILSLGFLGKLYSIAMILAAVSGTDAASIAAGLKAVSNGVSVALFSTMLGLGLALWTHCGTLVVSNKLNSSRE